VLRASIASVLVLGCAQPGAPNDKESLDPVAKSRRAASCRPAGNVEPVLTFDGARCEWLLLRDATTGLRLRSLADDAEADATGVLPDSCLEDRCTFEGAYTEVGPLLVARERSATSEMPAGMHLGVLDGEHLRFVDLWAGAGVSVHGDGTDLGPAFALAPHACGEALALFAAPRLSVVGEAEPPAQLRAREGRVTFAGDEPSTAGLERGGCRAIELARD
jgi:hypothetical protein